VTDVVSQCAVLWGFEAARLPRSCSLAGRFAEYSWVGGSRRCAIGASVVGVIDCGAGREWAGQ
jgi:hypothetical protein